MYRVSEAFERVMEDPVIAKEAARICGLVPSPSKADELTATSEVVANAQPLGGRAETETAYNTGSRTASARTFEPPGLLGGRVGGEINEDGLEQVEHARNRLRVETAVDGVDVLSIAQEVTADTAREGPAAGSGILNGVDGGGVRMGFAASEVMSADHFPACKLGDGGGGGGSGGGADGDGGGGGGGGADDGSGGGSSGGGSQATNNERWKKKVLAYFGCRDISAISRTYIDLLMADNDGPTRAAAWQCESMDSIIEMLICFFHLDKHVTDSTSNRFYETSGRDLVAVKKKVALHLKWVCEAPCRVRTDGLFSFITVDKQHVADLFF
jgi:hypothetical protein